MKMKPISFDNQPIRHGRGRPAIFGPRLWALKVGGHVDFDRPTALCALAYWRRKHRRAYLGNSLPGGVIRVWRMR